MSQIQKSLASLVCRSTTTPNRTTVLQVEELEVRCMLSAEAGIFFNAEIGQVTIRGGQANDVGSFEFINDGTVRANLDGFESQDFALENVVNLIFQGRGGDDTFSNETFFESYQIGGAGSDNLTGGSGADRLSGGSGGDVLDGGAGDDVILGLGGNDDMFGGSGDDQMFGGGGLNEIYGEDGNDTINGGNAVDEIYGGEGIDNISGFGGNDIIDTGNGGVEGSVGESQGDIARGHGGDDTFIGGNGLNIFYGGSGDDLMQAGDGTEAENRMYGQNGHDVMIGGDGTDIMFGHRGEDILLGMGGTDFLKGGYGNDEIDGGDDEDFIVYGDDYANYEVGTDGIDLTVTHLGPVDGVDTIFNAETLRFADQDVDAEVGDPAIIEVVTIQPIIVSNDDGSNTAGVFGTSAETLEIMNRIDEIYLVAGVDVVWLTANTWNDTFANVGDADPRPGSDLNTVLTAGDAAGVGNSDPLVLDMYFVEVSAAFPPTSNFTANGFARVDGNGSTVHIGDGLTSFSGGQDVAARVTAHEIAHNLGLFHVADEGNLMSNGSELNESQIETILESDYTVPVLAVV